MKSKKYVFMNGADAIVVEAKSKKEAKAKLASFGYKASLKEIKAY